MARRPFTDTLRDLRAGAALEELAEHMQKLVLAVSEVGKAGKLTLTIDVKPVEKVGGAVSVHDTIKVTMPNDKGDGTVFFVTPEGNLSRNHPRQTELGLAVAATNERASA
jgi:hypothetical protein